VPLQPGELIFGEPRRQEENRVVTLKPNQEVDVSLPEIKDTAGNLVPTFTTAWANPSPDILDLIVAADGLTALAKAKGVIGDVLVTCTVASDAGSGDYTGTVSIPLVVGPPAGGELLFGAPRDQV